MCLTALKRKPLINVLWFGSWAFFEPTPLCTPTYIVSNILFRGNWYTVLLYRISFTSQELQLLGRIFFSHSLLWPQASDQVLFGGCIDTLLAYTSMKAFNFRLPASTHAAIVVVVRDSENKNYFGCRVRHYYLYRSHQMLYIWMARIPNCSYLFLVFIKNR